MAILLAMMSLGPAQLCLSFRTIQEECLVLVGVSDSRILKYQIGKQVPPSMQCCMT